MRVGILAYLLHSGAGYRAAGVSTYTLQLLRHLPMASSRHQYLALQGRDAPSLDGVEPLLSPVPTHRPIVRIAWEQIGAPWQLRDQRIDLIHGAVNVLPRLLARPSVVTIHDLSFLHFPERFPRARVAYLRLAVSDSVRRAGHVIAVSEHTRGDLVELLGVPEQQITVVYSGVDGQFRARAVEEVERFRRQAFAGRPFVLHVGTLEPRKNLDVLIRAFAAARAQVGLPHVLALVGAKGWMYQPLFDLVRQRELGEHVRFIDYVRPSDLPLWYNAADLFAYPSAYEGFGLPVLEAMACGTPTITSAASALQELAGGACLTVAPGSEEDLQVAMARVLTDDRLRRTLAAAGPRRAAAFTWQRTAEETVRVYDRVLEFSR